MKTLEIRKTSGSVMLAEPTHGTKPSGPRLHGYAAIFGSRSLDLGGFTEVIQRGAFRESLRTREILALYSHNPEALLGRTKNGSLSLAEDARGLRFELQLPNTQLARDVAELVARGDVTQMSFGFHVPAGGDGWHRENGVTVRTLKQINLSEVSVVPLPAYEETSVALRQVLDSAVAAVLADKRRRLAELVG